MRYMPLTRLLEAQTGGQIRLGFREIESALDRSLPPSARRHQAWWSNTATHSHAEAWMRVGWRTRDLDLAGETVVFERKAGTGMAESGAAFRHEEPSSTGKSGMTDPVTFDRAKLSITARRILDDYTIEFEGDVQAALDKALHEARIAYRKRFMESIPRGTPTTVSSVDLVREDRDGR